jgi:hypothetical protein
MNNTLLYFHRRKNTNEVFYVGIGSKYRAKSSKDRNAYWHNIVNKVGYDIEIVHKDLSWKEACELETKYIKQFGRKDLGLGNLVNMTDGGDGTKGHIPPKKVLEERSKRMIGKKQSKETNVKKSQSLKDFWNDEDNKKMMSDAIKLAHTNNPEIAKKISESSKGKIFSDKTRKKMSISGRNKKMPDNFSETMSEITKGEKNGNSKLNEKQVLEIRKKYSTGKYTYLSLSKEYKVSNITIRKIVIRELWKHI